MAYCKGKFIKWILEEAVCCGYILVKITKSSIFP